VRNELQGASVVIYTLNEELHLPRCLETLGWCDDIVVVDSFSTDATEAVCRRAGVRFYQHDFTGFGDQRNWTFDHVPLQYPWALVLDADEWVPPELAEEILERTYDAGPDVAAFRLRRRFHMFGRWLRHASLYPTWVVRLVRVGRVRYVNRGHAETQVVDGRTESLRHDLHDENLKGVEEWFQRHNRYSSQEASEELIQQAMFRWRDLVSRDPLVRRQGWKRLGMRVPGRGTLYFLYSYLWRRGFLDGTPGLRYCLMKAIYQQMIGIKKAELRRLTHWTFTPVKPAAEEPNRTSIRAAG